MSNDYSAAELTELYINNKANLPRKRTELSNMNTYHIIHSHQFGFSTHSASWWNYYRPSSLSVLALKDVGSIITSIFICKTVFSLTKSF